MPSTNVAFTLRREEPTSGHSAGCDIANRSAALRGRSVQAMCVVAPRGFDRGFFTTERDGYFLVAFVQAS